jgi:hypothetical protein
MVSRDVLMRKRKTAEIINVAFIKRESAQRNPRICVSLQRSDGQGRLRFDIDKSCISIQLTAPYGDDRRKVTMRMKIAA